MKHPTKVPTRVKSTADLARESAAKMFGFSEARHGSAREYIAGYDMYLSKAAHLDEVPDRGEARTVDNFQGRIHKALANPSFDRSVFEIRDDFRALSV